MKKNRLDLLIVERGLSQSREKAKREIMSGWVRVNGETVRDPSKKILSDSDITVERPGGIFVSRGGEKLQRALSFFKIDVNGTVALDLGASTGGFTDCMLKAGASRVYSVDVGFNQIDYSLRMDKRVTVMEKTHAKNITREMFEDKIDFFTADLSFISILKILPVVHSVFDSVEGVVLLKPQFEAEPGEHKKGVVRDPQIHKDILRRVIAGITEAGFAVLGITYSPIKGPAGNIEFLAHVSSGSDAVYNFDEIDSVVNEAHEVLDK